MIYVLLIFIIWTWDITPLWVNIVVTILSSLALIGEEKDVI